MPGKAYRSIKRPAVYEAVKREAKQGGMSEDAAQTKAARIANSKPKKGKK
jgi:hypothetical protein